MRKLLLILIPLLLFSIFSPAISALNVRFTYSTYSGLVECSGYSDTNITYYCWNVSTASKSIVGTTGWVAYNGTGPVFYSFSVPETDDIEITFLGKNNFTIDSESDFIRLVLNPKKPIPPEKPEYTPAVGPKPIPLSDNAYSVDVWLFEFDYRFLGFIAIVVVALFFMGKAYKKKKIKVRRIRR